jgi:hypothetical protein
MLLIFWLGVLILSDPYGVVLMGWGWSLQIVDPAGVK